MYFGGREEGPVVRISDGLGPPSARAHEKLGPKTCLGAGSKRGRWCGGGEPYHVIGLEMRGKPPCLRLRGFDRDRGDREKGIRDPRSGRNWTGCPISDTMRAGKQS